MLRKSIKLLAIALWAPFLAFAHGPAKKSCLDDYKDIFPPPVQHTYLPTVADSSVLEPLRRNPTAYSRADYYRKLAAVVDIPTFLEAQNLRSYPIFHRLDAKFRELGPLFRQLFLDPAILTHGDALLAFLRTHPRKWSDPWELRQAFSDSLGTQKCYRALVLTPEQAQEITEKGMSSAFLREERFKGFVRQLGFPYQQQLRDHLNWGNGSASNFQSVTTHPNLAIAVANLTLAKNPAPNANIYLFELELPKIDIVSFTPDGLRPPRLWEGRMNHQVNTIFRGGRPIQAGIRVDADYESFVNYVIGTSEIRSVSRVPREELPYTIVREEIP